MNNRIAITMIEEGKPLAPLVLRGDYASAIARARAYGFDAMEIHVIDAERMDCGFVREQCQKNGIAISSVVTGQIFTRRGLSMTDRDSERRRLALREIEAYIDVAQAIDAKDGVVIGWIRDKRPETDDGFYDTALSEGLRQVGQYAADREQRILLEVINRYETNVFNTVAETLAFINCYGLENVLVHADTFHMNIEERDPAASIRQCGDKLGYIHFADSNRLYPGAGHIDFPAIMQALRDIKYQGSLSLECLPLPDSQTAALNGIQNMRRFMAQTES